MEPNVDSGETLLETWSLGTAFAYAKLCLPALRVQYTVTWPWRKQLQRGKGANQGHLCRTGACRDYGSNHPAVTCNVRGGTGDTARQPKARVQAWGCDTFGRVQRVRKWSSHERDVLDSHR